MLGTSFSFWHLQQWKNTVHVKSATLGRKDSLGHFKGHETLNYYGTMLLVARSGILKRLLPLCFLGVESAINQDIKAFSLYCQDVSKWLYYGLKALEPYILKNLVKSVTTVESLKFDEFSAMLIPVPPLSVQHRIIEKTDELLSLTQSI